MNSSCDNHVKADTFPNTCSHIETIHAAQIGMTDAQAEQSVYICTGPQSKRFHKTSHCRGLNSCSGEVLKVSISKAKSMGRTPCKWCYK